jgi:hypothetical protein
VRDVWTDRVRDSSSRHRSPGDRQHLADRLDPVLTAVLVARQTRSLAAVDLRPPNPAARRLRRAAELPRDRHHRRPLRGVFTPVLAHHAHGALTNFCRQLLCHGSILSRPGVSGKDGAIHERTPRRRMRTESTQRHTPSKRNGPCHALTRAVKSGDDRDRTDDLLIANQTLSQLSYVPEMCEMHEGKS